MKPHKINPLSFEEMVLDSKLPVLVPFGAVWDWKSRFMFDQVEWFSEKYGNRMRFAFADLDIVPEVFAYFQITDLPAFILLEDRKIIHKQIGYTDARDIHEVLKRFFGYIPFDERFLI